MTGRTWPCGLTIPIWVEDSTTLKFMAPTLLFALKSGLPCVLCIWASPIFDGEYQDLIMWEQITDAARVALNDDNNFGRAEVPFSDKYYEDHLDNAWTF
ncbi:hypothetical protein JG687_00014405 [Phytophthora cactorum]|uniref:Uncharacterized protein n=1 Tax=Phytophthora cactorum TaxID=29920 RepID=A0A8T1U1N4_9STRA|nr:hypothetical protein JG687_00014405 [Phytophthora cactorum]